jgi:hypothetical protein
MPTAARALSKMGHMTDPAIVNDLVVLTAMNLDEALRKRPAIRIPQLGPLPLERRGAVT